jgi:predicted RNA-binding Zn ribbon-like protein
LARAKVFRETLFALITGIVSGSAPPKAMLALLRENWIAGINAHELRFDDGRVVAELRNDAADFDLIASMIAYRMVEHVLPLPKDRLRICHGPNCSWLFIDSSKAGRRRWCDMAVCGNAAKSRRFHARLRQLRK